MAITKVRQNLLEIKDSMGLQNDRMIDKDLMPLLNQMRDKIFERVSKIKNIITERG